MMAIAASLSRAELALHWLVGVGFIGLIALGVYMGEAKAYNLYPVHKSLGTLLLLAIAARIWLRLRKGWPASASARPGITDALARLVHWVLLLGTLIMPVSGFVDSIMSGRGLYVFGLELVASNMGENGRPLALNTALAEWGETLHGFFGELLIAVIVLHIAAALKHHFIDRDNTLRRILGRN